MVAARKHGVLGNIDLRLAAVMVAATIGGSEVGVQGIEALKRIAKVDLVVGIATIMVLVAISAFVFLESWQALKLRGSRKPVSQQTAQEKDKRAFNSSPIGPIRSTGRRKWDCLIPASNRSRSGPS